jgi:hypothetical protein
VASYERLGPRLASELAAAHAQREQIERRIAELEATAPEIDEIVAERFGDLRSAIAEHLRTGRNIEEVRFLLRRYFESFIVRDDDGGRAIVANLRPDVVDDVMADLAGAKREALRGLTTAHNSLLIEYPEPCRSGGSTSESVQSSAPRRCRARHTVASCQAG